MVQAKVAKGLLLVLLPGLWLGCAGRNDALFATADHDGSDAAAARDATAEAAAERPAFSSYCYNGDKDPNETDFDCGGNCPPCAIGKGCVANSDCAKGTCVSFVCSASTGCSNRKKDGRETDVDCGGNECLACTAGKKCAAASDCSSGTCNAGTCN